MLRASGILIELVAEALRWLRLVLRSSESIQAENLFLRRQLALYIERGATPRRIDPATRIALTLLSRLFDWRDARSDRTSQPPIDPLQRHGSSERCLDIAAAA
jgi:putative transposase